MKSRKALLLAILATVIAVCSRADDPQSIGRQFHYETSYGDEGAKTKTPHWGEPVPLYKEYPGAARIKLPDPLNSGATIEKAINLRQSLRSFSDQALSLAQVSRILLTADGITHSRGSYQMRSAPSGGALYPVDIYIVASNIESLADGLYHFQVSDSSLELVSEGQYAEEVHVASNDQSAVGSSPLTIVMAARFDRSTVKYSDRGYRYTYMEAGCICQNIYLQAAALGLGTVAVGAFNDDALNRLLGIDGVREAALMIMPVGYPG